MWQDWQNFINSQINIVFFLSFPIKKRVWCNPLSYLFFVVVVVAWVLRFLVLFNTIPCQKAPSQWEWNIYKKNQNSGKLFEILYLPVRESPIITCASRVICVVWCDGIPYKGTALRETNRAARSPTHSPPDYLFTLFSRLFGFKNAQSTGRSVFCGKIPTYVWPARDSAWGKWFLFNAWLQRRGLQIQQWTCTHQWILHTHKSRSRKLYKPCSSQWICQTWTTCETQSTWRAESEAGVWIQQLFPRGLLVWVHVGLRIFLHHLLPVYILEHRWVFSAKNCVHVGRHNVHRPVCKGCNSVAQTTLSSSHFSWKAIWGWIRNALNTRYGRHANPCVLGVFLLRSLPGLWTVYLCIC